MQVDKENYINETFWFPIPEEAGDENEHNSIQQRILQVLIDLKKQAKLDATKDKASKILSAKIEKP